MKLYSISNSIGGSLRAFSFQNALFKKVGACLTLALLFTGALPIAAQVDGDDTYYYFATISARRDTDSPGLSDTKVVLDVVGVPKGTAINPTLELAVSKFAKANAKELLAMGIRDPRIDTVFVGGSDTPRSRSAAVKARETHLRNLEKRLLPNLNWLKHVVELHGDWYAASKTAKAGQPAEGSPVDIPGVDLRLIWIGGGSFQMGSTKGSSDESDEQPVHTVTLSGYWLGKYEVTQGQWEQVMGSNPSKNQGSNLPVEMVSWHDAMDFCRKVTERERAAGRLPEGLVYTLPTEAQWEYACRAEWTGDYAGPHWEEQTWYKANSGGTSHPVGTQRANSWGLHDMLGNVWEWCVDWYGDYPGDSVMDPQGPTSGSYRVGRGGCWGSTARSARRRGDASEVRGDYLGFRLALSSVR